MIDPSGDAKHTGRLIEDTLERGISLQCAEYLKKKITEQLPNIRIVLTRIPGETIKPLQNASFANRLDINLYLSLYFYYEKETPAHIALYYYCSQPITNAWHKAIDLAFYSTDEAHLINFPTTQKWANAIIQKLQSSQLSKSFHIQQAFGIPFKPLIGIKAPAMALEVGLQHKENWHLLIQPLIQAIESITS
jgi:hypothetical protein